MKRATMLSCMLMGAMATMADELPYLTLQMTDGTEQSLEAATLVITFADGQLVAANATSNQTFSLADLAVMYFSATPAATVTTAIGALPTGDTTVVAYTVGGRLCGRFASVDEARQTLPKGVYVMKTNSKTFKTTIK